MTREEMRDLDNAVAEQVMGFTIESGVMHYHGVALPWTGCKDAAGRSQNPKPYSAEILAAWEVVEKLREQGWLVVVKEIPDGVPWLGPDDMDPVPKVYKKACCSLTFMLRHRKTGVDRCIWAHPVACGESAPEAICRAALLAAEAVREAKKRQRRDAKRVRETSEITQKEKASC